MNILLLGANGQVGWELQRSLAPLGHLIACDRTAADLSDLRSLESVVNRHVPDVIVNAAAYTAVDKAESEPELAQRINAVAVALLAKLAFERGALLVHYSTDYVFDGSKDSPYTESDQTNPLSVYGKTKLDGEMAILESGCRHLIFRTSWVFATRGNNFIKTMLRLAKERDELRVVADQQGAPTSAELIADVTAMAIKMYVPQFDGIYNVVPSGATNWYDLARYAIGSAIKLEVDFAVLPENIKPITTSEYSTPATRPANSTLSNEKLSRTFELYLPAWKTYVDRVVAELEV